MTWNSESKLRQHGTATSIRGPLHAVELKELMQSMGWRVTWHIPWWSRAWFALTRRWRRR